MSSGKGAIIARLAKRDLVHPPPWVPDNIMFETMTGSIAYGCREDGSDDVDLVAFVIPPKPMVFPHLTGYIKGFGHPPPHFEQWQKHHIEDKEGRRKYDVCVYSIVKFFQLCRENNPNMVDVLFSPRFCVTHSTAIYEHLREHRKEFLHKGCWYKFRGYAYSQLTKIEKGTNKENPRRHESIRKYGYDTKFAYHIVRLALECEQILRTGNLVLNRDKELYKSIRRGEWTVQDLKDWFGQKEKVLEDLHDKATFLPEYPDEEALRKILVECLEMHYGSLKGAVEDMGKNERLITDLRNLLYKYE